MSAKTLLLEIHKDLVAGNIQLPSLPEISLRIKKIAADANTDIPMLSKVAEMDPAFCGYLLQISNSPIYRGSVEIQKINLAIGRLGLQNTCNIAMTYAVRSLFRSNRQSMKKRLLQIWKNSTYTAAVACIIAEHSQTKFDPDEAVLAGLLQDIGCLPLIDKAAQYPELIDDDKAMQWLYQRYGGLVGVAVLNKWGLNQQFVEVAKNRDNWKYNQQSEPNLTDLVLIAKLHSYLGKKPVPRLNLLPSFVKLQLDAALSPESSLQFIADAKQRIKRTMRALGG